MAVQYTLIFYVFESNKTLPSNKKRRATCNLKGLWLFMVTRELLFGFSECMHTFSFLVCKVRPVLVTVLYWFGNVAGILVCCGWCGVSLGWGVGGGVVGWKFFFQVLEGTGLVGWAFLFGFVGFVLF